MAEVGTATIPVEGDFSKFERQAKAATGANGGIGKSLKKLSKIALVAGGAAAAGATVIAKSAIDTATSINESLSKNEVLFGTSSKTVAAFADTSAKRLGISKASALEATGTFGNLFRALEIGEKPAAKMSVGLTKLAADLASFNNASPEEALEAIRSGLVGETEPLRKFGVNLNDAALRAEALKQGLVKTTKQALTPQQKALAVNALLFKQTAKAQGDFQRTSGGLANQQRILKAQLSDLSAELGSVLLPIALKVTKGITSFIQGLRDGTGAGGQFRDAVVSSFERVKTVALAVVGAVRSVVQGFRDGKAWAVVLAAGVAGAVAAFTAFKIVVGVQGAVAALKAARIAVLAFNASLLANPIGLTVAAIAAFVAILVVAYKKSETFRNIVNGAFNAIKTVASTVFPIIGKLAKVGLLGPIPLIIARWGQVKAIFSKVVDAIVGIVGSVGKAAADVGRAIVAPLHNLGARMLELGVNLIQGLINGIRSMAGSIVKAIKESVIDKIPGPIKKFFGIFSPSKLMHGYGEDIGQGLANGVKAKKSAVAQAVADGLLFPLDAEVAKLEASRDRLQAAFDSRDNASRRSELIADVAAAKGAKRSKERAGRIRDAIAALKEFQREQSRASQLGAIELKIKGVQQLQAWRGAIAGIRSDLKNKLGEALDAFSDKWEKTVGAAIDRANEAALTAFDATTVSMIANGPAAQELARLQAESERVRAAAEDAANARDLADAMASGDQTQIAAAQAAIEETARQRAIAVAQTAADAERDRIQAERDRQRKALEDQQAADRAARYQADSETFAAKLDTDLQAEATQLAERKQNYAAFAAAVNKILKKVGVVGLDTSAEIEAALSAGPGKTKVKKRAAGGPLSAGDLSLVGEHGPELFIPRASGTVIPHDRTLGALGGTDVHLKVINAKGLDERELARKVGHEFGWAIATAPA